MTNITIIRAKIAAVEKYLRVLKKYNELEQEKIGADVILKGAFERYLYLVCQSSIDLGEAIIAFLDFRKPNSYSDIFYILEEEKFVSKNLAKNLVKMAGFRNIIAHDYEKLDFGIVFNAFKNDLKDVDAFVKVAKAKLK